MNTNDQALETVPGLLFDAALRPASHHDALRSAAEAGPLPVADVAPRSGSGAIWMSTTTIDGDGRIAVRAAIRHLGWAAGRVTVAADPPAGRLTVTAGGVQVVTAKGMLRLAVAVRRACTLDAGDRLLLIVPPDRDVLCAFTAYAVERWSSLTSREQPGEDAT